MTSPRRASRQEVYRAIESERNYQLRKALAVGKGELPKPLEAYIVYMDDYLRELKTQISRTWTPDGTVPADALDTLRKITALGVAAMEHNGAPLRHHLDGRECRRVFRTRREPCRSSRGMTMTSASEPWIVTDEAGNDVCCILPPEGDNMIWQYQRPDNALVQTFVAKTVEEAMEHILAEMGKK